MSNPSDHDIDSRPKFLLGECEVSNTFVIGYLIGVDQRIIMVLRGQERPGGTDKIS